MSFHSRLSGKDLHAPSVEFVENHTGTDIPALKVVALNGLGTSKPQVVLANPSLYPNFGVTASPIINGQAGQVAVIGFLSPIDTSAYAMNAALYSDAMGNLTATPNEPAVAFVTNSDATKGSIYVFGFSPTGTTGPTPWYLLGNLGTDPNVDFLGTTDNAGLQFRTNNNKIANFDENGRFGLGNLIPQAQFHQKSHTSTVAPGYRQDTYYLETQTTTPSIAYAVTIPQASVFRVEFRALGRVSDGTDRASFVRSGVFYRESSNVLALSPTWQADETLKSNPAFNISYNLGVSLLNLMVTAPSPTLTQWTGRVTVESLNG